MHRWERKMALPRMPWMKQETDRISVGLLSFALPADRRVCRAREASRRFSAGFRIGATNANSRSSARVNGWGEKPVRGGKHPGIFAAGFGLGAAVVRSKTLREIGRAGAFAGRGKHPGASAPGQTVEKPQGERERAEALSHFNRTRRRVRRGRAIFPAENLIFQRKNRFPAVSAPGNLSRFQRRLEGVAVAGERLPRPPACQNGLCVKCWGVKRRITELSYGSGRSSDSQRKPF